jgi:hypothetical protein
MQVTFPHMMATLPIAQMTDGQTRQVLAIPGIKPIKNQIRVPWHAVPLLVGMLQSWRLEHSTPAAWVVPPPNPVTWEEVDAHLRALGEVRPEFLGDFPLVYQKRALSRFALSSNCHLWHATGAGKTFTSMLWALIAKGTILVVTRSAARFQYAREWRRFTHLNPYVLKSKSARRKRDQSLLDYLESCGEARPVVIVGWETILHVEEELALLRPHTIIWDESHLNKSSKLWKSLPLPGLPDDPLEAAQVVAAQQAEATKRGGFIPNDCTPDDRRMLVPTDSLAHAAYELAVRAQRRCATTATPVKDRVRDMYAQLNIVEPGAWGTATQWLDRYADRKMGTFGIDTRGSSNVEELKERVAHVVDNIPYQETHRNLPPKRRQSLYLSPEDQEEYDTRAHEQAIKKAIQSNRPGAILEAKLAASASRKMKAVLGFIDDHLRCGQKVTLFTNRKKDVERWVAALQKLAVVKAQELPIWGVHGDLGSSEDRATIAQEYMDARTGCCLVATIESFGASINLHDTDAVYVIQLPYTPGDLRQMEGRFARQGQKRPVVIYYVICAGTVDERLADILISKLPAVESVVGDTELMAAQSALGGTDRYESKEQFAESILSKLVEAEAFTNNEDALEL